MIYYLDIWSDLTIFSDGGSRKTKKIEKEIRDVKDVNLHKRLYYHTIL